MVNRPFLISIIVLLSVTTLILLLMVVYQRGKLDAAPPAIHVSVEPTGASVSPPTAPIIPTVSSQPPVNNATAMQPPAEILTYIEFVQQLEQRKQRVIVRQSSQNQTMRTAIAASNDDQSGSNVDVIQSQTRQDEREWEELITDFNRQAPPVPCTTLYNAYADHLSKTKNMITRVADALQTTRNDPQNALRVLESYQGRSGDAVQSAEAADAAYQDVCSKYHISPDMKIQ